MRVVPFELEHCFGAKAHPTQAHYQHILDDPQVFLDKWSGTRSAIDRDELVAIGGTVPTDGITGGWVLFTDRITPVRFLVIHRAITRTLSEMDGALIAHVDLRNPKAVRWVKLLDKQGMDDA